MQFSIVSVLALAAGITSVAAVPMNSVGLDLFSNGDCGGKAFKSITVYANTCYDGSNVGWSSMKINKRTGLTDLSSIEVYSRRNCAGVGGSHGYSSQNFGCLNGFNFGGAGNAVGVRL